MDPLLQSVSSLAGPAVTALFAAIWQGVFLAACVALCLRLLPALGAPARSLVWLNVFLLLALLHVLPVIGVHGSAAGAFHSSPFLLDPPWSLAIAGLWVLLSLWRGAQLLLSAIRLHAMAERATPVQLGSDLQPLLQLRTRAGRPGRSALLCVSPEVARPSVFGFFRPRILFPQGLAEKLSTSELRQVVMHEMEHLRRADDWTNLLQKLCLVLFPLNPAMLWVERRLCAERELACDDRVLQASLGRKAYAICLTHLAEYSMVRRGLSLALGAWERQSELARRVHRILRRPTNSIGGRHAMLLTASLILGVLVCALALAHAPQLVSFAPLAQPAVQASAVPTSAPSQLEMHEFGASAVQVKAVMPQRPVHALNISSHRRRPATKLEVKQIQPLPSQATWIVLTEWQDAQPPARVVFAVTQDFRSSYAAIATENGWLIVQI
jgi:beta-lactamase regulating signal transducer with metallopeptidase domain